MEAQLDKTLYKLGRFGLWQMGHYCLLGLCFGLTTSWQLFAIVFIGYYNYHVCVPVGNATIDEGIPYVLTEWGYYDYDGCSRYVEPGVSNETEGCTEGYLWDLERFEPEVGTMVMEWGLICDKEAYVETSQTVFNVGVVVGFFFCTPWSDIFGRKKVFFICQLLMNIFGVAMAFSPVFEMFCVFQFLTGMMGAGLSMAGTVLALEMFRSDLRVFLASMTSVWAGFGMVTLPLWAFVLPNWRNLQLGISVAGFITLIYVYWCPESFRWLASEGRYQEANRLIARAAKLNKLDVPANPLGPSLEGGGKSTDIYSEEEGDDWEVVPVKKTTFRQYIASPKPRRYFIIMCYVVFTDNIMYYGLSLMMGALDSMNVYLNTFINAMVEFPAIFFSIVSMAYFGRRVPMILFHIFGAVFMALCGIIAVVPLDEYWTEHRDDMLAGFAFVGKFWVSTAWCVQWIYVQEMLPTSIRSTGLGVSTGAGYIGSIIAPYAVYLFRITAWIPTTIFAVLCLLAGLLIILVPETMGRDLPDSVEDVASWPLTLTKAQKEKLRNFKVFGHDSNKVEDVSPQPEKSAEATNHM